MIPQPAFGLEPITATYSTAWVEPAHTAATDVNNPLGSAARPRKTLPSVLPAGTVLTLVGAIYIPANFVLTVNGNAANPVIVRGMNAWLVGNGIGRSFTVAGGFAYFVGVNQFGLANIITGSAVAYRGCEIVGTDTTAVAVIGHGNVISECKIHHNGDSESATEDDDHGVLIAPGATYTWVLDSDIHHNGGDAIQVGQAGTGNPYAKGVFIARNQLHEDRENAVDIKRAQDVIITENEVFGYRARNSSAGEGIVVHNSAIRVWATRNRVRDCVKGLVCTSAQGYFAVANDVREMRTAGGDLTSYYGPHPITTYGSTLAWMVDNHTDGVISVPTGASVDVSGNVAEVRIAPGVTPVVSAGNVLPGVEPVPAPAHQVYALYESLYGVAL